jgi:hypothetical protein
MDAILRSLPARACVSEYVLHQEVQQYNLEPHTESGQLIVVESLTAKEEELYVDIASELDDGEAITAALAFERGWAIATDDVKANKLLIRNSHQLIRLSTSELLEHWSTTTIIPPGVLSKALRNIELHARYAPAGRDPYYEWWRSNSGNED